MPKKEDPSSRTGKKCLFFSDNFGTGCRGRVKPYTPVSLNTGICSSSSRYSSNEGTPPVGVTSCLQGIFTQLALDV